MNYGIKVKGSVGYNWLQFFTEDGTPAGPIQFKDTSSAEIYAQNHELKNYIIEVINDNGSSSQGPQFIND
jgi:hypothetical protein